MAELFDLDEAFGEDYLYFTSDVLDAERSEDDTDVAIARGRLALGMRVLDAPCGHGRVALRLAQRGFAVVGVDRSALYLDVARSGAYAAGVEASFLEGDLRHLPVDGPFDAALCWFSSFGYFDDEDNLEVLREFRRVLRPGGVLVVETLNHDGFVRSFTESPESIVTEVDGNLMIDRNTFDVTNGRVHCHRVVTRDGATRASDFSIRLLTVPEWHAALERAGFTGVEVTDREGLPPDVGTWRVAVRAEA